VPNQKRRKAKSAKCGLNVILNNFVFECEKSYVNSNQDTVYYWHCTDSNCKCCLTTNSNDVTLSIGAHNHDPQTIEVNFSF
jgi:hypothetical protein